MAPMVLVQARNVSKMRPLNPDCFHSSKMFFASSKYSKPIEPSSLELKGQLNASFFVTPVKSKKIKKRNLNKE